MKPAFSITKRTLSVLGVFATLLGVSPAELTLNKGDSVAIIGNGLADRFQYDGWLETLFQSALPDKNLVFRNLGFPGDTVSKRPRNQDFTSPEDYLKKVEADTIFVFFGYNESFEGDKGLPTFKKDLGEMIDRYRALKPNGSSEPSLVLFSPIAQENLNDPNFSDASENNARLALYTKAISEVAADKKCTYVDLFAPSQALYDSLSAPLTINGIHLNETGNREIAAVIASALTGKAVSADTAKLGTLRKAVMDKEYHWFYRYRAVDGNDIWGGRADLKFTDDQTNREVLQHELVMLDVMTANRDRKIWATAKGEVYHVDDSNVPAPVPVKTNIGGGSPSSSAEKEGTTNYISGEAGLGKMTVPDGFQVNLFADESRFPELVNPVQMNVDNQGRLWVAAWQTYPKWEPLKEMNDSILILTDTDGDGTADTCKTFAKIQNPLGFEFWNGGIIVSSQPNLVFLKDTDGDDVADVSYVILQGIGSADTHHAANNLIYGPDGAIYWQSGIFLHNNMENPWGPSVSTGTSGMYRFDPRQYAVSFHAPNSPNPHGISFDYWGYHYATDGTGGQAYQVRPDEKGFKMERLLKMQVRPVPANEVVSSDNFPESMQGDFLICNTIGFLGIKQYDLKRDGYSYTETVTDRRTKEAKEVTQTFAPGEVWGEPKGNLLVSSDKNFRPTDAVFGADGGLYIADWHNVIIGHMQHNVRDPNRDHKHGRVYRMIYKDRPLQAEVKIAGEPIEALLKALEHPVNGVRQRARVELSARDSNAVIAACQVWMKGFDASKAEDAHNLLEALWLHQQHNVRNTELLTALLGSPVQHARIAAATVQHHWYVADPTHGGGTVAQEETQAIVKSGVLSDTDDLTTVRIGTIPEKLQFDVKEFSVKAGKQVKLTFANPDFMPHNFVIVQPGAADEVGQAAMLLGAEGFELQWVPKSDKILASTPLVNHQGESVLEFAAPSTPGDYQFVCTFPGHHLIMRGVMKVMP